MRASKGVTTAAVTRKRAIIFVGAPREGVIMRRSI
jgi:hypothetical protein